MIMTTMLNTLSKTMGSGTIYYSQFAVGATTSFDPDSGLPATTQNLQSFLTTGININVGSTGGTDTWYAALYNSAGVLVAQCATAGVTAGTALTTQQIPWYGSSGTGVSGTPVTIPSGTYLLALQSSGTTAKFLAINSPIWPLFTGSQTGTPGTLAAITSPATTYTADVGPMASLY